MDLYFSDRIDITSIFLDLFLVIITTAVTYYFFSYKPKISRKKTISLQLKAFKRKLDKNVLMYEFEIKTTYHKSMEEVTHENPTEIKTTILFQNFNKFISLMVLRFAIAQDISREWQIPQLIGVVNSLIIDDARYIKISQSLTDLYHNIETLNMFIGYKPNGRISLQDIKTFFKSEDDEKKYYALNLIEETYEIGRSLTELIAEVCPSEK